MDVQFCCMKELGKSIRKKQSAKYHLEYPMEDNHNDFATTKENNYDMYCCFDYFFIVKRRVLTFGMLDNHHEWPTNHTSHQIELARSLKTASVQDACSSTIPAVW